VCGRIFTGLAELDAALIELDGTPTRPGLGANATVGVSMAAAWPSHRRIGPSPRRRRRP
jgi:enolase